MNKNPEQIARDHIDHQLDQCGWVVQDRQHVHLGPEAGVAVREYPTDNGTADYVLFFDRKPIGIIEAKRAEEGVRLTTVEEQSNASTVGEICSVPESMSQSIISTNLIKTVLNQIVIESKYFVYLFQGGYVRDIVKDLCKGSTRAFINQTILGSINFPICSKKEQMEIVQEIDKRLSVCDKLEETIDQSLQKAESLGQSILKKAFAGKLLTEAELEEVRKAPDWEPAEKLLERIKTGKEPQKIGKRK